MFILQSHKRDPRRQVEENEEWREKDVYVGSKGFGWRTKTPKSWLLEKEKNQFSKSQQLVAQKDLDFPP